MTIKKEGGRVESPEKASYMKTPCMQGKVKPQAHAKAHASPLRDYEVIAKKPWSHTPLSNAMQRNATMP